MSLLSLIALAIGLATVIAGLALDMPDRWFFGFLAVTCMVSGAEAAYSELRTWALAFLVTGILLAVAAARAVLKARRGGT